MELDLLEKVIQLGINYGLSIFLVFYYIFVEMPKQRKHNKETMDKLSEEIANLSKSINQDKKYTIHDFKYIAPISVENTTLRIYKRLGIIIDRNNLVRDLSSIQKEVDIIINDCTSNGRDFLRDGKFDKALLDAFFSKTESIKEQAIKEITGYFKDACDKLKIYNNDKKELLKKDCNGILNKLKIIEDNEKNVYMSLKRKIWQTFEVVVLNVRKGFNEIK